MHATNQIDYLEFQSTDPAASRAFCEAVFGWEFEDDGPDYAAFKDGRIAGGFARGEQAGLLASGGALAVIYHPRLEDALAKVTAGGARITAGIFSFPGGRRFHFIEPGGNEMAVWGE